jgi:hypothetical protein
MTCSVLVGKIVTLLSALSYYQASRLLHFKGGINPASESNWDGESAIAALLCADRASP